MCIRDRVAEALATIAALDAVRDRAKLEQKAAELRELIEAVSLQPEVVSALGNMVSALGSGPFAVRSSMVGEDGENRSFAGQLDTYLFQQAADRCV